MPRPTSSPTTGIAISNEERSKLIRSHSLFGKPPIPSAADTAKVSSPSGTIKRMSFSIARDYAASRQVKAPPPGA
jgi:hypothetical protein